MTLPLTERTTLLNAVARLVETKHFNPNLRGVSWKDMVGNRRDRILSSATDQDFEKEVNDLLRELKTSHTAFVHRNSRRVPARTAINATFLRATMNGTEHWMFLDVHEGGPADAAGLEPGDLLLRVNDRPVVPPEQPEFALGDSAVLTVQKRDGRTIRAPLAIPNPRSKQVPISIPKAVIAKRLPDDTAYLKVAMFPGAIGIDVAAEISKAFQSFGSCEKLIVDLRGNTGGGIGCLRLMSYLTAEKLEVGYSLTRKRAERGYKKEELPRFGRIPDRKRSLLWLALRYGPGDHSIVVVTEGLGAQKFHGREVILVNEHTASAGEMVTAFAAENGLATVVGAKTAGRLLSGKPFKLRHEYLLWLPTAQYLTWSGALIEGSGVPPHVECASTAESLLGGKDVQLDRAKEIHVAPFSLLSGISAR